MKTNGEKGVAGIYTGVIEKYQVLENFSLDLKGYAYDVLVVFIRLENGVMISQKITCCHSPYERLLCYAIGNDFDKILGRKIAFNLAEENGEVVIKRIFSPDIVD